jgi:hypothetical protein
MQTELFFPWDLGYFDWSSGAIRWRTRFGFPREKGFFYQADVISATGI